MATFATQAIRSEDRMPIEVFVVSQNLRLRESLQEKLGLPRWKVMPAAGGAEALRILRDHGVDDGVLLLDPSLPFLALPVAAAVLGLVLLLAPPARHVGRELLLSAAVAVVVAFAIVAGSARFPDGW